MRDRGGRAACRFGLRQYSLPRLAATIILLFYSAIVPLCNIPAAPLSLS